jgi:hypothetical protein
LDSDHDGVPDAWEVLHAGFDPFNPHSFQSDKLDGEVDRDRSVENAFLGDGLSAVRECRGIVLDTHQQVVSAKCPVSLTAGPTHRRLDPHQKDLFVRGDDFSNSAPPNTAADVLCFSVAVPNGNAFAQAGIAVHDVTGLPSFVGAGEPPFVDIAVVKNFTTTTDTRATGSGVEDGFLNHTATANVRNWSWDTKGDSCIGTTVEYALKRDPSTGQVICAGTRLYHLNLMHYVFNRPYRDEQVGQGQCGATATPLNPTYRGLLDPLDLVEDFNKDNGIWERGEDRFISDRQLQGDRVQADWKTQRYGTVYVYQAGCQGSVFDVDGDGRVENPRIADPRNPPPLDGRADPDGDGRKEYTAEEVQVHTVIHELGHAVGICPSTDVQGEGSDACHTTDDLDVMSNRSDNWDRAGSFGATSLSRSLIYIHNQ